MYVSTQINYSEFEVVDTLKGCVDSSRLDVLLPLIDECSKLVKQEGTAARECHMTVM